MESFAFGIHELRVVGRVRSLDNDLLSVELASSIPLPRLVGIGEVARAE